MSGCSPRACDHHCARVCQQYTCICDYHPGYSLDPRRQLACCQWENVNRPRSNHYAYTDQDAQEDTLTRYFGMVRALRDPHDPIRFTGINHVPSWLHADLSSLDTDYKNHLREREIMAASRYTGPRNHYAHRSIRPGDKTYEEGGVQQLGSGMSGRDVEDARRGVQKGTISAHGLRSGNMPFLD